VVKIPQTTGYSADFRPVLLGGIDVRFGSLADIRGCLINVRFKSAERTGMSAFVP
jgi:hypothetical protein